MAELILTAEEKATYSWLELDDATVGKLIKKSALALESKADDMQRLSFQTCAFMLCNLAFDSNAENLTFDIDGLLFGKEERGKWRVTIQCIEQPSTRPQRAGV